MYFLKHKITKLSAFLLILSIFCTSMITAYAVTSTVTIGVGTGVIGSAYIVYKVGLTSFARNGRTGAIDYSGSNAAAVIQFALDNLTPGRTWKEKVVLNGFFYLSTDLKYENYTIIDGGGSTLFLISDTILPIYSTDHSSVLHNKNAFTRPNHDVEIRNLIIDVNGAFQSKVDHYTYQGLVGAWIYNNIYDNIKVRNALTFGFAFWPVNQAPYPQIDSIFTNLEANNCGDSSPDGTAGFWFSGGSPAKFKGAFIDNIRATDCNAYAGIELESNIESNSFGKLYAYNNVLHGVAIVTSDAVHSSFNIVSHDNGGNGLHIMASQYIIVYGDFYRNGQSGIYCDSSFNNFHVNSYQNGDSGIYITGGGNNQVIGGLFKENGQNILSTSRNGITIINSERDIITGIQGLDYQGIKTQQYCVQSAGSSNYLVLTSSLAYGNDMGGSDLVGANNELGHNVGI